MSYMRQTLTISLPEVLKKDLDRVVKDDELTYSDIVRESLRDYFFVRKFRKLRRKMMAQADAQNIHNDEDVFKIIS